MIALDFGLRSPHGRIVATANALAKVPAGDIQRALARHVRGDGGEVDSPALQENERSLLARCRLLSAFQASNGTRFWIISEADRSPAAVLLPEDF